MFIGHVAAGLAVKKFAPKTGEGTALLAALFVDLLGAVLLITGVERVRIVPGITAVTPLDLEYYPWSHSLATTLLWAALIGLAYYLLTAYRRGAILLMLAAASHWALDFISHIPDLPLWPGGPKAGLGLWMSLPATIAVEGALFALGVFLYWSSTAARGLRGRLALWLPVALLLFLYFASFLAAPSSPEMLGWAQSSFFLIPLWGYLMDRTRAERSRL